MRGRAFLLFLLLPASALGQATPAALELAAAGSREAELAADGEAHWLVRVVAGQGVELVVQQRDATLQVRVARDGHDDGVPYQNDAGRGALLHIDLIGEPASMPETVWRIGVRTQKPGVVARYRIAVSRPRPLDAATRQRHAAQVALADAEQRRRDLGSLESGRAEPAATRLAAARAAYRRAIDLANGSDDCLILRGQAGLARLEFAQGDYAAARQAAEAALRHQCGEDEAGAAEQAVALRTLGSALGYLGDFRNATARSEQALALYRRTGDPAFQAMLLGNLTANYRVVGDTRKALDTADAALRLAESIGDRKRALFVRESEAAIRMQRGELAWSLDLYRQVLRDLADEPYPLVEGLALNSLGLLYRQLGDADASIDSLRQAEAAWQRNGDAGGVAETRLNLADAALAEGRLDEARDWFRQALDYDQAHQLQREEAHARLGLGQVALAAGDLAGATAELGRAEALARRIDAIVLAAAARQSLGDVAERSAAGVQARRHYRAALALARRADDIGGQAMALASLARLARDRGDLVAARPAIERAVALIEQERARIQPPQLRTAFFATRRAYYDLLIDVLMQLDTHEPSAGYAALALEASERARARSLQDRLAERSLSIRHGLDPALLGDERTAELQLAQAAYALGQLAGTAPVAQRREAQRQLDDASRALDDARGRIRAANPRYAELAHPQPLDLAAIQRDLLDADVSVDAYWLAEPRSYRWRIRRDGLGTMTLPAATRINAAATALRAALLPPPVAANQSLQARAGAEAAGQRQQVERAAQLAALILPDALPAASRHVVIPDGELQTLPFDLFEALDVRVDGRAASTYLPSLIALRSLRAVPRDAAARTSVAVIADPVFRGDDPRLANPAPLRGGDDLDELPALRQTAMEATAILQLADPSGSWLATGFDASRERVLGADWSRVATVHFASHALLRLDQPALSGIVLSRYDAGGAARDGFLRADDLYNLSMPVELVVLGVCDAALGRQRGADGVFSLARAFFHAGARRVLASLWAVDDRAAAELGIEFYRGLLQRGEPPALALANAQRRIASQPRWQAPRYWAGFVLQGDWR